MSSLSDYSSLELTELGIMLLRLNYANVAIACVLVYDYLITISSEVTYLFHGRWCMIKFLYLICRYLPFVFVTLGMIMWVQPASSQTVSLCQIFYTLNTCRHWWCDIGLRGMYIRRTHMCTLGKQTIDCSVFYDQYSTLCHIGYRDHEDAYIVNDNDDITDALCKLL